MEFISLGKKRWHCLPALGAAFTISFVFSTLYILHTLTPTTTITPWHARPLKLAAQTQQGGNTEADWLPSVGEYGKLMLSFLREDLPFTIFVPSPPSVQSMLVALGEKINLSAGASNSSQFSAYSNGSFSGESSLPEGIFAVMTRIFGFSTVPSRVWSSMVPRKGELALESVTGHKLYVSRHHHGALVVNNIPCSLMDMTQGAIVIHVVDGILMDSEFEQSLVPFKDDDVDIDAEGNA